MTSIEHQMAEIYIFVDDFLKAHPRRAQWRRSPNAAPRLSKKMVEQDNIRQTVSFIDSSLKR